MISPCIGTGVQEKLLPFAEERIKAHPLCEPNIGLDSVAIYPTDTLS
jgi:hypothetical protein